MLITRRRFLIGGLSLLAAPSIVRAQMPMLPGFPPGTFQNRAALDAAGGGGGSFTTLDPSNIGSTVTLSGGNLIATNGAGSDGFAHSVASHSTGQYYCEFVSTQATNSGFGIMVSGSSVNTFLGAGNNSAGSGFGGTTYTGPVTGTTTCPAFSGTAAHVFGMAVDLTAGKMWIKDITAGGNWNANGTADPATGVNGAVLGANLAGASVTVAFGSGFPGDNCTVNFGAAAYTGTPPSGFGNW